MGTSSIRKADGIGMRQRWTEGWSHYLSGGGCHPYAASCLCSRIAGVAPALVLTAEDDPLRDETLGYADRLKQAGVAVRRNVLPAGTGWPSLYGGKSERRIELATDDQLTSSRALFGILAANLLH